MHRCVKASKNSDACPCAWDPRGRISLGQTSRPYTGVLTTVPKVLRYDYEYEYR